MKQHARHFLILIVLVLVLAGVSCAPPAPEPSPSPSASAIPSKTQTPRPTSGMRSTPTAAETLPPTPAITTRNASQALLPDFSNDVVALEPLTCYWIDLEISIDQAGESARLEGNERIQFTNPGDLPLDDLVLMLWPNNEQYLADMQAGPVLVNGELHPGQTELDGLALRVPLQEPLEAGQMLELSLSFSVQIKSGMNENRPRRMGLTQGAVIAPTFYPLLPPLIDGQWQVDAAPPGGDTTNSVVSLYTLTIRSSPDQALIVSGSEVESTVLSSGQRETTYVSGPVRDVALALGPFEELNETVHDVVLHAWYLPEHKPGAERMLDAGVRQFSYFWEWVGPYPYQELDLVDAPGAYRGIEYPGLVYIGTLGGSNVIDPTVHEVAHQWFYGMVGNDQIHEPWLDEAAATYSQLLYYEQHYGSGAAASLLSDWRTRVQTAPDPTRPIGDGISEYRSDGEYVLIVYLKGALFLEALRAELGDDLFFDFWRAYYDEQRYKLAQGGDFKRVAEQVCACELDSLFNLWVYEGGEFPGP